MSSEYPNLHPKFGFFFIFHSFKPLILNPVVVQTFLEEMHCIPSRNSIPPKLCGLPMKIENMTNTKFEWIWRCATRASKKNKTKKEEMMICRQSVNPSKNTVFDGTECRIAVNAVLAIILAF